MDEPKHDWPQTVAGCLAIILLLGAGILVGRCSAPAAAQETQPALDPVVSLGYDFTDNAGRALAELDAYLTTITTPPVPQYRNTTPSASSNDRWDQLAQCETGGNWAANTGNGFGGGLQFMHQRNYSTWLSFGGGDYASHPWDASREQQIAVAERVLASSGWNAWPGCSRKYGWN
jgi:hypothetical protein